jgi:three-Cys-motif partner protein
MPNEEKYFWRIGSPPPHLDQHSRVKHGVVEDYVRRYIQTLMSQARIPALHLSLIDGFCGGGSYRTEQSGVADGSPLLMIRAVQEARALINLDRRTPRTVCVDYHFNDIAPDTTEHLTHWLDCKRQEGVIGDPDFSRISITNGPFVDALPRLLKIIHEKKMGEHAIFVLDQYNYNDVPLPQIAEILRTLKGAEVILTFNVGVLLTYLSDRAGNRKPLQRIGLDQFIPWDQIGALKVTEKRRWRQILQRYLAQGIRSVTGARYMTLFFVRPWGANPWDYWLIHLSNAYRAHDVMKTLHWKHSTEFGHELEPGVFVLGYDANKDSDYSGQPQFDFGEHARIACIDDVREHFGKSIFDQSQPIQVQDIFRQVISSSTAAEEHLMEATRQLHQMKDIVVVTKDGRIRQPSRRYARDDVIESSPQIGIGLIRGRSS